MNASQLPPRWLLALLIILFFGSGACALVYQVMWLRLLSLVFGVTVYAASTVLAAFMAGLGVGSFLAGRFATRITRPLAAFGIAEILVGITAFLTPPLLEALTGIWISLHDSLPNSLAAITVIRFIVAFLVLIVPTSLMGATLPLVVQSAITRNDRIGGKIGVLYAINTTGAIAGALIAGFYFISDIGVAGSFQIAAATNIAIGLIALAASSRLNRATHQPSEPLEPQPLEPLEPLETVEERGSRRAILWVFFISGLMSLALEIIWFRMLVLFLRPTAYAFTIMLACVLAGIALGSLVAAPLLRLRRDWLTVLAMIQAAIGFTAVLSFNALTRSQEAIAAATPVFERLGLNTYLAPLVASSMIAMLPTMILLGLAFPIGLTLWAGDIPGAETSRRVGVFYSLNVIGAIIGSVLAGFVVLPQLGSRWGLIVTAGLATASSIVLAMQVRRRRPRPAIAIATAAIALYAGGAAIAVNPFDVAFERFHRRETLLWREEGAQTTVAIHERPGNPPMRIMYLDGNHQANDSQATAFIHHRIGALPVMLHPRPKNALVVGLGGGATPGAVARMNVDVDVVELSSAVVAGSAFFKNINFDLLARPNVRLHVDDGRNFLLMNRKKYDVITADIILPRHAGAGALYSREYFELVRKSLNDGGLVMQWNGGDSETEYKLLLRTFLSVFPHTTLWGDGGLMLGSTTPFTISRTNYDVRRQSFEQFPWDLATLQRIFVAGPEEARAFAGDGPILSDDRPVIEYFLSLPKNDGPGGYKGPTVPLERILAP
ncbi:MAG TPA: fused MFS/spermidine synthase [Vicinamibacterales bacterium]|nr:fused MFS/spermidine synthase [Vicinamibacterales bacterium]